MVLNIMFKGLLDIISCISMFLSFSVNITQFKKVVYMNLLFVNY